MSEADEETEIDQLRRLLSEGLDLCVRARRLDEQEQHMHRRKMGDLSPEVVRSATPYLWAQEQFQTDLDDWEKRARRALVNSGMF